MRLFGYDAINYVKAQGGKLNRFPDGSPGVEYNIAIQQAEQIAATHPYSIWTDVEKI